MASARPPRKPITSHGTVRPLRASSRQMSPTDNIPAAPPISTIMPSTLVTRP
jgi:hypothetical protein